MQLVVLLRYYTSWPAIVDSIIQEVLDAITLDPIVEPIIDFGKSAFELARDENDDEYLREQGVERQSILRDMGIFYIILILTAIFFLLLVFATLCAARF